MIRWFHLYNRRTILAKLKLSFFGFFFLIAMILATWLLSLNRENRIETEIDLYREIENSVLDMDRKMEKAKRLHRDFFLYQAKLGLNEAHVQYAQPSVRLISQAVGISSDLKKKISQIGIDHSLRYRNVDLNLYLSSAKRFADTSIQSIELLTRLVAPNDGLEPRFENLAATLSRETINSPEIKERLHEVVAFYQQYKVARQRHILQSAFNVIYALRQQIGGPEFDSSSAEPKNIDKMLASLEQLGHEILDTDSTLKQIFNDFSLQEQNVIPISRALVEFSHEEVGFAKERVRRSHQVTFLLITILTCIALIWSVLISRTTNRSVTRRIIALTEFAQQLRQGHLDVSVVDGSVDELGQLSRTFSIMVGRIRELVDDLESKIMQRTQQLAESERWFRHLFENSPLGIFRTSLDGKVLLVNKDGANILGCDSPDEVINNYSNMAEQVYVDHTRRVEVVHLLQTHGEIKHFECRWKKKNGEIIWVSINARLTTKDGTEKHGGEQVIDGFVLDITKRKRAEVENAKLEILNRQLHKNQSLARMAGSIAHHFNNQLTVVIGNIGLAMEAIPGDANIAGYMAQALQGAHKAAEVSSQMLTYLGLTSCRYTQLDLSETCRQILSLLQASAPKKLMFKADLPTPGPKIEANANQMQQVVINLVTNAFEAVGNNQGVVNFCIKTVSSEDITMAHRFPTDWQPRNRTYACIEVTDTGCGIAAEVIDNLFDPFYSSKFPGRGLGLSVVWGVAMAQKGVFSVESEIGSGSTFRVFFPVSVAEDILQPPKKITKTTAIEAGGTVLLVDDEEMVRNLTKNILRGLGYTAITAKNGMEAAEILQNNPAKIHVVLLDLNMPDMNGWETLAALRRIRPDLPVVIASGHDESEVFAGDHLEHSQAFLHKPFQRADLKEALAKAMAR